MAFCNLADIQKSQYMLIFVHFGRGKVSLDNFAKNTIVQSESTFLSLLTNILAQGRAQKQNAGQMMPCTLNERVDACRG
jgi:hypothetical protein